jgi:hypothetical protein
MDLRKLSWLPLVCLALTSSAWSSPLNDAAKRLDGTWRGDGFSLTIDSQRDQARIDPNRPFQWQRFLVKEARPDEIVFSIGPEIFEAKVKADQLTLTGTSFRGEHRMRWEAKPPDLKMEIRGTLAPSASVVISGAE